MRQRCMPVGMLTEMVKGRMEMELCVMKKMNWVDDNMDASNGPFGEDINSLPAEVSVHLKQDTISPCALKLVNRFINAIVRPGCSSEYSSNDSAVLYGLSLRLSCYMCFKMQLHRSCRDHVKAKIDNFFQTKNTTAARTAVPGTG